jgi:nucleotide-binding universal stress UspA family protein
MRLLVGYDGSDGGCDALALTRILAEALEASVQLGDLGVETRAFGGGTPAGVINDLAEHDGVDTIVVGSPHRGPVGRTPIGSVADGLLHGAPCEVTVAPHGYAAEERGPFRTIAVAYDDTPESKVALKRAEKIALAATGRALSGVPGAAIVEACEEVGADLLVAGSRGYGR